MSKEQRAEVDAAMRAPRPPPQSLQDMRAGFAAAQANRLVPDAVRTSETTLGDRRALIVEPAEQQGPGTILYFHGGGWALGGPETSLSVTANLVKLSSMQAFSFDYRLAPENPFPAAVVDCVNAYRALLDAGKNPAQIALVGDSAGGALAVTTVLKAREQNLPTPAALIAFSPGLDLTLSGESMNSKRGIDPIFTREMLGLVIGMYCAGQDVRDPLLSPALFADLAGFPPMMLQVGANEVLLDDSIRMAARAIAAGVDVILDVTADAPHVFQAFAGVLGEADQALERAAFFLQQHISGRVS